MTTVPAVGGEGGREVTGRPERGEEAQGEERVVEAWGIASDGEEEPDTGLDLSGYVPL